MKQYLGDYATVACFWRQGCLSCPLMGREFEVKKVAKTAPVGGVDGDCSGNNRTPKKFTGGLGCVDYLDQ